MSQTEEKTISKDKLRALVASKAKMKEETAEMRGDHGAEVKAAIDGDGLNKTAFGWICKLEGMTDNKRADAIRSLKLYIEHMDYSAQLDLVDMAEADEDDDVRRTSPETIQQAAVH